VRGGRRSEEGDECGGIGWVEILSAVLMRDDKKNAANNNLIKDIIELMDRRMNLTRRLHRFIEGTFSGIQAMTIIAYVLGIFLIVSSVLYYSTCPECLGRFLSAHRRPPFLEHTGRSQDAHHGHQRQG
jgi:hypothetical protein